MIPKPTIKTENFLFLFTILALFFSFSLSQQTSTKQCSSLSFTCEENEFCNSGLCECRFGYYSREPNSYYKKCEQFNCVSNRDCSQKFPNSRCNNTNSICTCEEGYFLSHLTGKCVYLGNIPTSGLSNWEDSPSLGYCRSDSNCVGKNTVCLKESCKCRLGFIPIGTDHNSCVAYNCTMDAQCGELFPTSGPLECGGNSTSLCQCPNHHHIEVGTQRCLPDPPKEFSCVYDSECGPNAICSRNSRCMCQLGFNSTWWIKESGCQAVPCEDHYDCYSQIIGTRCNLGVKRCECDLGYKFDRDSQSCLTKLTEETTTTRKIIAGGDDDGDDKMECPKCGKHAYCDEDKCRCVEGYHMNYEKTMCIVNYVIDITHDNTDKGNNLVGIILGSVFGGLAGLALLVMVIYCSVKRIRAKKSEREAIERARVRRPGPEGQINSKLTIVHENPVFGSPSAAGGSASAPEPETPLGNSQNYFHHQGAYNPAFVTGGQGVRVYPNLNN